jgi:uncharacterized protein
MPSALIASEQWSEALFGQYHQLNEAHAEATSSLTSVRFKALLDMSFMATGLADGAGFILAFDEGADYDNANFNWCKARYERFVYIDRVIIDAARQGQGLGRKLYAHLFAHATDHHNILCEINSDPPNPASEAFHLSLGFTVVGAAQLSETKRVRYYHKVIS